MKLGKFIDKFSHNNLIRLVYKNKMGYCCVMPYWDDVSMDWEVNKQKGCFRHYINNEVLGVASIVINAQYRYPEAINIIIEHIEHQTIIPEIVDDKYYYMKY